jgi:hypothetical protein
MNFENIQPNVLLVFFCFSLPTNNVSDRTDRQSPPETPIYHNLNKFSPSTNAKQSISEYYVPCEFCFQSINNEDFETHKVCFYFIIK